MSQYKIMNYFDYNGERVVTKSIKQIRKELQESNDTHLQNMERALDDKQMALLVNAINNQRQIELLEEE
jgi:DNA-binding MurR/RpiR family transcriptional regulator